MDKILIFAGTTEGRELAEFCVDNGIAADVSTATAYGASLLPEGIGLLSGRLDAEEICILLRARHYAVVIDATHPYAKDATANIRAACLQTGIPYRRLLRRPLPVTGESVDSLDEMIGLLNRSDDTILSTLGSKSIAELTKVQRFCDRIWLRLLPSDSVSAECVRLGFDPAKLIFEKGPFSTEQNLEHIRLSGAKILLTKESGSIGGYPKKEKAAKIKKIRMITLRRPFETADGYDEADMKKLLLSMKEKHML